MFHTRELGNLGDLGDSVSYINLDHDLIALGGMLPLQELVIGYRERPDLSVPCLKRDRPLGLVNTDDRTCKGGCGFTGVNRRNCRPEQTDCRDGDPRILHDAPSSDNAMVVLERDKAVGPSLYGSLAFPRPALGFLIRKWLATRDEEKTLQALHGVGGTECHRRREQEVRRCAHVVPGLSKRVVNLRGFES